MPNRQRESYHLLSFFLQAELIDGPSLLFYLLHREFMERIAAQIEYLLIEGTSKNSCSARVVRVSIAMA